MGPLCQGQSQKGLEGGAGTIYRCPDNNGKQVLLKAGKAAWRKGKNKEAEGAEMTKKVQSVFIIAGGLLEKDSKFLLVNAKVGVPKGLWNLPAGGVDDGETVDEAAVREVREETGFDVKIQGLVGTQHRLKNKYSKNNIIRVNFKMEIVGGELNPPEDEIAEAKWFSIEEIKNMQDSEFAFGTKECILDYAERGLMKQRIFSTKGDVR